MEGDLHILRFLFAYYISIHSLRMEGDPDQCQHITAIQSFQSTPSAWRETQGRRKRNGFLLYFNPLPPHGGRLFIFVITMHATHFNPLPPHGGRLAGVLCTGIRIDISIHSLRMEGDWKSLSICWYQLHFNPLPPHGGRRFSHSSAEIVNIFQSTPSAWRETIITGRASTIPIFQSTPSAWRETYFFQGTFNQSAISIHSLRMEGDFLRSGSET